MTRRFLLPSNHPAQTVYTRYRIEGWLSDIGDVDGTQHTSGCTSPTSALPSGCAQPFAERLFYTGGGLIQQATFLSPYAATGQIDAATKKWHYSFAYDGLARLKSAAYSGALTGRFSLQNVQYDASGNLLSLKRYAPTSAAAHAALDDLTYSYASQGAGCADDAGPAARRLSRIIRLHGHRTRIRAGTLPG